MTSEMNKYSCDFNYHDGNSGSQGCESVVSCIRRTNFADVDVTGQDVDRLPKATPTAREIRNGTSTVRLD
jgi:hypothetical protein